MPPNCDNLTKLTASVFWERYVQFGDLLLRDFFVNQRLIDKMNKYSNLISEAVQQDPAINNNTWTDDVKSMKDYLQNNITVFRNHLHP